MAQCAELGCNAGAEMRVCPHTDSSWLLYCFFLGKLLVQATLLLLTLIKTCVMCCRFGVAAVREVCINNCSCSCRQTRQSDEDIVMAKQQNGTWLPMSSVAVMQNPEAKQMAQRSPRLAIALQ
jgi:hypothetical protein